MTLRKKTLLILLATLVGLLALLYLGYNGTVMQSFMRLEDEDTRDHVAQVQSFIRSQVRNLSLQIKDWAHWDATYAYAGNQDEEFIDENVNAVSLQNLRLNLMVFVNEDGEILDYIANGIDTLQADLSPENLQQYLDANPLLLSRPNDPANGIAGVQVFGQTPVIVVTSPILPDSGVGEPRGTLLWARFMQGEFVDNLTDMAQSPVRIVVHNDPNLPPEFAQAAALMTITNPSVALPDGPDTIYGFGLLNDLYGQPSILLQVVRSRNIYQHGQYSLSWFALSLAGAGVVFATVFMLLMYRLILTRLERMSQAVQGIGSSGDFSQRLDESGNDELSELAKAINASMQVTAEAQGKLRGLNEQLEQRVAARTTDVERELLFQEAILDSMNEGVLYGTEDEIEYANRMMSELTGYDPAEFIGQPQSILFSAPMQPERKRILGEGSTHTSWIQHSERKLRRKDGKLIDVAFTTTPLLGYSNGPKQIAIVRDVTEEKALQERRDRFLANASHELRTPLTNLITRLYLLRRQPEQFQTHLDVLDKVTTHMKNLVEDLLDVSRFNKGTMSLRRERMRLAPLIREVVEIQQREAERKKQTMTTALPSEEVWAFIDRKRMIQVLTNLIFNAISYTPTNGRIDISLTTETSETATTYALLHISDNGSGIDAENLDQIFQPFFRASQEVQGTGLGLSIVKEIITGHGGQISVESSVGSGTTFTIRLLTLPPESPTENSTPYPS
jgi:PAS domain S-box-containing protein